ncbi:unnamed protein product [Protopolystoma xenopodis]|uniref:Uncharacterized protein n=1 Tax=Protopolystoma xenopodis TaxID=117903 RepID=A0A448WIZ1_9PLAT|nr:unnamed protein product [Protopolystoma xenopodis]
MPLKRCPNGRNPSDILIRLQCKYAQPLLNRQTASELGLISMTTPIKRRVKAIKRILPTRGAPFIWLAVGRSSCDL